MSEQPTSQSWAGVELRNTFLFLAFPAVFAVVVTLSGIKLPSVVLYGVAGIVGLVLFFRSMKDPEWLLAVSLFYFPLSKEYTVPLGAGINGTNVLFLMMMISLVWVAQIEGRPWVVRRPGSRSVAWLFFAAIISGVTVIAGPFGLSFLISKIQEFKGFLDQFIFFFLVLNLVRDGRMARRLMVYMIISGVLVVALGAQEAAERYGRATLDASRVKGPLGQPNDFGAFLVYSLTPLMGVFLVFIWRMRSWLLLPYFALVLKVLLATFSRGAYLALGASSVVAGYIKGKWFLLMGGIIGLIILVSAPQLLPDALVDRMGSTTSGEVAETDRSAEKRLILWQASVDVSLEHPIFGVGFKVFPKIKSEYTSEYVEQSDNHNMYLYISSQMGIPAMLLCLWVIFCTYRLGFYVYRENPQSFAKAIGLGVAAMAGGVAAVNMFGSRMVNLEVTCFFWASLAVVSHLAFELKSRDDSCNSPPGR